MIDIHPLANLGLGIVTVIGLIVVLRLNAFIALVVAALVVSLLAPGEAAERVTRVAAAFGETAGKIGIVIGLAAVIGQCLMVSGAADRIVQGFLNLLGRKRGNVALAGSGFVLSVPVFFDTVFYLLIPLARSMYQRTQTDYLKYILAIAAGAAATHTLVPPTPGPLVMAGQLGIGIGAMTLIGIMVALPCTIVGLLYAAWAQKRWPIPMRPLGSEELSAEAEPIMARKTPGLALSLLPILLPVVLITADTLAKTLQAESADPASWDAVLGVTGIIGNANFALLLSAIVAMGLVWRYVRPTRKTFAHLVEEALLSGGLIVLITSGGGAFGAMLKEAQVGEAIEALFGSRESTGIMLLFLGFVMSSLLKIAQGSGTVAIITASGMLAAMIGPTDGLPYHAAYLATAVGCGSMVVSWMNDSGFWIIAKMGGLTEIETLKSWSVMLAIMGATGFVFTLIMATLLPLT